MDDTSVDDGHWRSLLRPRGPILTQEVALTAVGVFAMISVVRPMATSIIHMSLAEGTWASPRWQAVFWSSMIGLALAIWLIFGSRGHRAIRVVGPHRRR